MKFTLNWLQEYVQLGGMDPEKLAGDLTMLGLEVDAVTPLFEELAALKTGMVVAAEPHPDADKLTLCRVAVGDEMLQIVCGAPNVRAGLCVVVALPGTTLPGDFKIKRSKVRGVESAGMLCSERELGLSDSHTGIMELPEGTASGLPFLEATGLRDTLIDVDLTPNRPDCASVIGIAREVAGITGNDLVVPYRNRVLAARSKSFSVEVEAAALCPRYAARLITGVTIAPSPWWLRKRLLSVGMRPINNVVDITNLVMLEYGQPLHAFDFDTLAEHRIVVRTPRPEEKEFTTLDKVTRPLDRDMLMICDGEGPVAVAGIMGGLDSEVTGTTVNVLLESACFDSVSIRRTARRLNLSSEAGYRFERGVDPDGTIDAMERAVALLCELAGGTAEAGGQDCYPGRREPLPLTLRVSRTAALIGMELSLEQVSALLGSIDIPCVEIDADTLHVTPPSFRVDLEREIDLVEEVARLIGYDKIPVTLPTVDLSYPEQDRARITRNRISAFLTNTGFSEAINYSFTSSGFNDTLLLDAADRRRNQVRILNPLSEELDVMRTSLLPGLLENVRRNINHQKTSCRLFEIGKVFFHTAADELPEEPTRIAAVLAGNRYGSLSPYHFKSEDVDIYDAKGVIEAMLEEMRLSLEAPADAVRVVPASAQGTEPFGEEGYGLTVVHGDTVLGSAGRLKQEVLRSFGIKRTVYYVDLDFSGLCALSPASKAFRALPIYPAVKRDIALVVPASVAAGDLVAAVLASHEKLVEHCEVFDVYQGDKIESGHKSIALTITYRSETKTLTEKNVEKANTKLVKMLTDTFGGSFREA